MAALRSLSRWLWLSVPLLALVELGLHYHFADAAPPPDEWSAVRAPLERLHQEGDLVVVAPYWAEPNARAVLGDTLMPLADVARPSETRYPRVLELSILGQATEVPGLEALSEEQVGRFRLRVLRNTRFEREHLDFADLLEPDTAEAVVVRGERETPCAWNANARVTTGAPALHGHPTFPKRRFECSKTEWHFVGVTVIEDQRYRPRRCIWAHPQERQVTVVRFPGVELQGSIRGHGGLSWFLERESKGTPIELEVVVGGTSLGQVRHEDGQGWSGFEFSTEAYRGQTLPVEFRVSAQRSRQREYCFYAGVYGS